MGVGVDAIQGRTWAESLPCGRNNQHTGVWRVPGVPAGTGKEEQERKTGAEGLGVAWAEVVELAEIESWSQKKVG